MHTATPARSGHLAGLPKAPSGIDGLDEITGGGLPLGRPTLVCGSAGCGKTLMGMEFLVRGALKHGDPGVFIAFEEHADELAQNVASLGFDLEDLIARKLLVIDYVHLDRTQIDETGEFDLEGLFVRLNYAIETIGAKRVVVDTIETLFSSFTDHGILRAELRRLFAFLKAKGVTSIVTCERGQGELTRHGIEEYVSDCVILLDHRVENQLSTRRLRIVKYRGSPHGADEYPFLIDRDGISVLPITSLGLDHAASNERVTSGVQALDAMLEGRGFYRGSTILVSGTAGTGKTTLAAHFAQAICERGERCLYLAFEESPSQLVRNMRSVGLDLQPAVDRGLLEICSTRPTLNGLEMHLANIHRSVSRFKPSAVVLDPMSNMLTSGTASAAQSMLIRLIDYLKALGVTAYLTSLTGGNQNPEQTEMGVSSLVDAWILVRDAEFNGSRSHGLYVLKARGMSHSRQVRELVLTDRGIELREPVNAPAGTGAKPSKPGATKSAAKRSQARSR